MSTRISKACQECRQRKIRCTGERPCKSCQAHNTECVYRHLIRVRRKAAVALADKGTPLPSSNQPQDRDSSESPHPGVGQTRDEDIYHSVSASQDTARSGNVQLYYGAASNFAFLQHLHRSLLPDHGSEAATPGEVQEGGAGLDMFYQRPIFFGTTSASVNPSKSQDSAMRWTTLPLALCQTFLDRFIETAHHEASFIQEEEVRSWARILFDTRQRQGLSSYRISITLAVLANGALATEHMDWAELLYTACKMEAAVCDEVVNLHSVQVSMLLSTYQFSMGRPNQSYLHLGTACRRAFAMGLHRDIYSDDDSEETQKTVQERRTTMWLLYCQECWGSFSLGRVCSIKLSDIACRFPEKQPFIVQLARISSIAVQSADMMYGQRRLSLWETWKAAGSLYNDLRKFAEEAGLAFASKNEGSNKARMQSITLHTLYYHTILITFRPFLIVSGARQRQRRLAEGSPAATVSLVAGDEMWLREACRHAVDASRDQLSFIVSNARQVPAFKFARSAGFFVESSCAVLMYDSYWNKHTYSLNLEYITAAIKCVTEMAPGEPLRTVAASIKQILRVLERKLSDAGGTPRIVPRMETAISPQAPPANNKRVSSGDMVNQPVVDMQMPAVSTGLDTWNQDLPAMDWGFDIFTTDLNHFFPLDDSYGTSMGQNQFLNHDAYREPYA